MNYSATIAQLEAQAGKERERLHASAQDLRRKIVSAKDTINPSTFARNHFAIASGVTAFVGLALGYSFSSIFNRK